MNEASDVPGYTVEPPHGRWSVVQGIRVYMSSNLPGADPTKYIVKGRGKPSGAQVKNEYNGLCWRLNIYNNNNDHRIALVECDSSDQYQYFYLSELGEIRTTMKPSYCLHTPYYANYHYMYMIPCYSDMYGGDDYSSTMYHRVTYDTNTKQFRARYEYNGVHCLQQNLYGYDMLDASPCTTSGDNGLRQQHTFMNGNFLGNIDSTVRTRHAENLCWTARDDRWVEVSTCIPGDPRQRFYMNERGEIRNMYHQRYCLDPYYGHHQLTNYNKVYMQYCYSIQYGVSHSYADYHKFIWDNSTETFESVRYPGWSLDYNYDSGWLWLHAKHGEPNQQMYFEGGGPFFYTSADDSDWDLISEGDLPWTSEYDRNPTGVTISSTNEGGDPNKYFTEVLFYQSTTPYYQYKILFPETRDPDSMRVQFSQIEMPGLLLPTNYVMDLPTAGTGTEVRSVLDTNSTLTSFGCLLAKDPDFAIETLVDETTSKYMCQREAGTSSGIVAVPSHGNLSIVKAIRVYSIDNCDGCDPTAYILEGREDESSSWVVISEGDLPWKSLDGVSRNAQGLAISSTYEAGDSDHSFTEVPLGRNTASYLDYKVTFTEARNPDQTRWSASQIELPGLVL
jgi:hypothetical protein